MLLKEEECRPFLYTRGAAWLLWTLVGFSAAVPHSGPRGFRAPALPTQSLCLSPAAHFLSGLRPSTSPPFRSGWSEDIDFPEQVPPRKSPPHQTVLCEQSLLILLVNVITHQAIMFPNVGAPHTTCSSLLGQHKMHLRAAYESPAPGNPSEEQPALSVMHKSISASQMPETHL